MNLDRISIELTNQCSKACWFCYNRSGPGKQTRWAPDDVAAFVLDCAGHGIRAVSFGGGEPLEYPGLHDLLVRLDGVIFRSITTNGLLLDRGHLEPLINSRPDKVHVSLHFPHNRREVARVLRQVLELQRRGIAAGVNLLVCRSQLDAARSAAAALRQAGLTPSQIVFLPMRGTDTPTPEELASVAGPDAFQSVSCLRSCGRSDRFCSIGWDRTVAWCSYTAARRPLDDLSFRGLLAALDGLAVEYCGTETVPITVDRNEVRPHSSVEALEPLLESETVAASDYPAAHSMDTHWFAVDAVGQVGKFESGEPGAVPKSFLQRFGYQYSYYDFVRLLISPDAEPPVLFDAADLIAAGPGRVFRCVREDRDDQLADDAPLVKRDVTVWRPAAIPVWAWLKRMRFSIMIRRGYLDDPGFPVSVDAVCWVRDEAAAKLVSSDAVYQDAVRLHVPGHVVLWLADYPAERLRRHHAKGLILSVMHEWWDVPAHRLGFFTFECDDYACGPYQRTARPRLPIHINQLPAAAREVCSLVQFPSVRFSEAERFQPAEHTTCDGGYHTWRDLQGNDHDFEDPSDEPTAETNAPPS